jgi:type IV pilus assembly protein PilX
MSMNKPSIRGANAQKGSALIISLLLLIALTLIGLTTMRSTRLETAMAGGARESGIAFQAAEAALRDAEQFIETTVAVSAFDGSGGLLGEDDDEPDFFSSSTWTTGTGYRVYSGNDYPDGVVEQPRYVIKYIGDRTNASAAGTAIAVSTYGSQQNNPTVSLFRITAWGISRDGSATTVLQSYYGKSY